MIGKVLWFDIKKGFGFIRGEDRVDYFAHYSKINAQSGEFRTLTEGERVTFEPFFVERPDGNNKPQAKNIVRLESEDEDTRDMGGSEAPCFI
jgi:CspA family cold shock protein